MGIFVRRKDAFHQGYIQIMMDRPTLAHVDDDNDGPTCPDPCQKRSWQRPGHLKPASQKFSLQEGLQNPRK